MNSNRLEAFSDGVVAILITIMVLELKVPKEVEFSALNPLLPVFLAYILSFINLGIYWSNHHHMLQATKVVNGKILWANLNLLFWMSLFPFTTGWMGQNNFAPIPTAIYGVVLVLASTSYSLLQLLIMNHDGKGNEDLVKAVGKDRKGKISIVLYTISIPLAFVNVWISCAIYAAVAAMWFTPDSRIEERLQKKEEQRLDRGVPPAHDQTDE